MGDAAIERAIEAWTLELGAAHVVCAPEELNPYLDSVCASVRQIPVVLKAFNERQVQAIVKTANRFKVSLYPISCGRQWGMGSKLPVMDGAALVDLSGMNRIHEVNVQHRFAIVEPGVTQQQLQNYIKKHELPLMFNVTGAPSCTSLIGNAMDRGVGYFKSRAEEISNMRIVLGHGEIIQTGFGHYQNAVTANLFPAGIGPSLDGLFMQGSFGIVTSACMALMHKPEKHMAAVIKIDADEKLPGLIDALVNLRVRGVITTIAHVGERNRLFYTLAPLIYEQLIKAGKSEGEATRNEAEQMIETGGFGPWSASVGVLGNRAQLRLARTEIRKAVKGFAQVMFLSDRLYRNARVLSDLFAFVPFVRRQRMLLNASEPIYALTRGETTDESVKALYWAAGDYSSLETVNPDHSDSGILFCLPILPAIGSAVAEVVDDVRRIFAGYGFDAAITVNLINTNAMESVISLSFNRQDAKQTRLAHECIQEMEARFMAQGYPPYRVGINSMHHVVREGDTFWRAVSDIKAALDPNGIISPGRYNLIS